MVSGRVSSFHAATFLLCLFALVTFVSCKSYGDPDEYRVIEDVLGKVDHYKILNLDTTATKAQIKKSFYKLSMIYHPDKIKKSEQTPESTQIFLSVTRAYEVLSSETLRSSYDHFRTNGVPWEKRYYGRWAHRYGAPEHGLGTVVLLTVVFGTALHWILRYLRYHRLVAYVKQQNIYKQRAAALKKQKQMDAEEEVEVEFTGLKPPSWKDLLPISITIWAWKFSTYWLWYIVWILILRHPFDAEGEMLAKHNMTKEEYEIAKERYEEKMKNFKTSAKAKKMRRRYRKYMNQK